MPKMKSKSGAKKRFRLTGSGKIKRKKAYKRHLLASKSSKRSRRLRQSGLVDASQVRQIKRTLLA